MVKKYNQLSETQVFLYDVKHAKPLNSPLKDNNLNPGLAPMSLFIRSTDNKMINFIFSLPLVIVVQ